MVDLPVTRFHLFTGDSLPTLSALRCDLGSVAILANTLLFLREERLPRQLLPTEGTREAFRVESVASIFDLVVDSQDRLIANGAGFLYSGCGGCSGCCLWLWLLFRDLLEGLLVLTRLLLLALLFVIGHCFWLRLLTWVRVRHFVFAWFIQIGLFKLVSSNWFLQIGLSKIIYHLRRAQRTCNNANCNLPI